MFRYPRTHWRLYFLLESLLTGVDCLVKYKMGTCKRIQFNCEKLHLWNQDPIQGSCKKGDKMIIYKHDDQGTVVPTKM